MVAGVGMRDIGAFLSVFGAAVADTRNVSLPGNKIS
jgi:hypothetical protein